MREKSLWIVTGGQTGVDRAAMDVALKFALPLRGWCPKGRLAEDGAIDIKYPLQETPSEKVEQRTEWNARDSDGTLLLSIGVPKDGTSLTAECAKKYSKPLLELSLDAEIDRETFLSWLERERITILNIAGPRESHQPGFIYSSSVSLLEQLLAPFSREQLLRL